MGVLSVPRRSDAGLVWWYFFRFLAPVGTRFFSFWGFNTNVGPQPSTCNTTRPRPTKNMDTQPRCQATLQILNRSLKILSDMSLRDFQVSAERCNALMSQVLRDIVLPPLTERGILKIVSWFHWAKHYGLTLPHAEWTSENWGMLYFRAFHGCW